MKKIIEKPHWKGYSLEEMQLRHVVVKAQIEIEKYRLENSFSQVRDSSPLLNGSVWSRATSFLSYAEYAIGAFSIARKAFSIFRKSRK